MNENKKYKHIIDDYWWTHSLPTAFRGGIQLQSKENIITNNFFFSFILGTLTPRNEPMTTIKCKILLHLCLSSAFFLLLDTLSFVAYTLCILSNNNKKKSNKNWDKRCAVSLWLLLSPMLPKMALPYKPENAAWIHWASKHWQNIFLAGKSHTAYFMDGFTIKSNVIRSPLIVL